MEIPKELPQKKTFLVRPYQSGDEAGILKLFGKVFGTERAIEHWRWQFERNPYGEPMASLAVEETTGDIVGQYTVMPVMMNVMGKAALGSQSLDSMVDPSFRMLGMFELLAEHCYKRLINNKHKLVFGFPNQNSFPGFIRKLEWKRVAFANLYQRRLSIAFATRRWLPLPGLPWLAERLFQASKRSKQRARGPALSFHVADSVPPAYEAFWSAIRSQEILCLWKDSKYFKWRYDEHPANKYSYAFLAKDGDISAFAVTSTSGGVTQILEFMARDHNVSVARYLLERIEAEALKRGSEQLIFIGTDLDFFNETFADYLRMVNFNVVFCLRPFVNDDDLHTAAILPQNWTVTLGDTDAG